MDLNSEIIATIQHWASLFADEVQGKMGYPKSAKFIGRLIERDGFAGRQTLLQTLRSRGYSEAEFAAALALSIQTIEQKADWSA
jgi:hypothetical protein